MNAYDEKKQFAVPKQEWSTIFRPSIEMSQFILHNSIRSKVHLKKSSLICTIYDKNFRFLTRL